MAFLASVNKKTSHRQREDETSFHDSTRQNNLRIGRLINDESAEWAQELFCALVLLATLICTPLQIAFAASIHEMAYLKWLDLAVDVVFLGLCLQHTDFPSIRHQARAFRHRLCRCSIGQSSPASASLRALPDSLGPPHTPDRTPSSRRHTPERTPSSRRPSREPTGIATQTNRTLWIKEDNATRRLLFVILSTLPVQMLLTGDMITDTAFLSERWGLVGVIKLLRLTLWSKFAPAKRVAKVFQMTGSRSSSALQVTVTLVLGVALCSHYSACLLVFGQTVSLQNHDVLRDLGPRRLYRIALEWAFLTMFANESQETEVIEVYGGFPSPWFQILILLVGSFATAIIFGTVTNYIQDLSADRSRGEMHQGEVGKFIRAFRLDAHVANRLKHQTKMAWDESGGADFTRTLDELPIGLRFEIQQQVMEGLFSEAPVFANLAHDEGAIRRLTVALVKKWCAWQEVVVYEGRLKRSVVCASRATTRQECTALTIVADGNAQVTLPMQCTFC